MSALDDNATRSDALIGVGNLSMLEAAVESSIESDIELEMDLYDKGIILILLLSILYDNFLCYIPR